MSRKWEENLGKIAAPEVALERSYKGQFIPFHLSNPRAKQVCFIYNYVCPSCTKEKHELGLKIRHLCIALLAACKDFFVNLKHLGS
jgi:hypothetical protein